MLETGPIALESRWDDRLHGCCQGARQQWSKVQQPVPRRTTGGMLSTSPQLDVLICSAALAGTGSCRRCAARCVTFCIVMPRCSEHLADHAGLTDRRTYPSLRLLLSQELASVITVQALINTSLRGFDPLAAIIMMLVSAILS